MTARDDGSVSSDDTVAATPAEAATATPTSEGGNAPVDLAALDVDTSGRYALGATHASGGLGRVLRARDKRLHRTVAVKELLQRTPAAEARFVREALITARLEHPGIVPVHDAARRPSGEPFYSMKLVSGRTLKELIAERATLEARLALVPNVLAVAEAIAYAHSRDVIHRDLKPANVIVGDFGETVVIDWGLAKDLSGRVGEPEPASVDPVGATLDSGSGGSGPGMTVAGNVMGTPSYMAPEQARGGEVDARADVYALGALLYEVFTGDAPHTGKTNEEILARAILGEHAPVLSRAPDVPSDLVAIVDKAMARDREQRYPTAAPLAEDLRRFQTGQLVSARHYGAATLVRRWVARHRAVVAVASAAAVALAVTGVVSFRRVVAQRNVAERERAAAEGARHDAEAARADAEARSTELVFRRAETELRRDPTTALAVLKTYPITGPHAGELGRMIDDAIDAGVARHVLRTSGWVLSVGWTAEGDIVAQNLDGQVWRWDGATGQGGPIGRIGVSRRAEDLSSVSPDGRFVAIGTFEGPIDLLASADGSLRKLTGHRAYSKVMFSDDGRVLLSYSGGDDSVRIWDTVAGAQRREVVVDDLAFATLSADGQTYALVDRAGTIQAGRVEGNAPRVVLRASKAVVMALSRDGAQLAVTGFDKTLRGIDLRTGKTRLLDSTLLLSDVAISPRGDLVAAAELDGIMHLYPLGGGASRLLRGHEDGIYHFLFSADGATLYSASDDGTVRIWDVATGESRVIAGHQDDVDHLALSADGTQLASASLDGTVRTWPLRAAGRTFESGLPEPAQVRFVRGGDVLAVAAGDQVAGVDIATGAVRRQSMPPWARDRIPALGRDKIALVKGRQVVLFGVGGVERALPVRHQGEIVHLSLSPDDQHLILTDDQGAIQLWDLATETERSLPLRPDLVSTRFFPDGIRLAVAGGGWIEVWDIARGVRLRDIAIPTPLERYEVSEPLVSDDGSAIAIASSFTPRWFLWDLDTNQLHEHPLPDGAEPIVLSPDGSRLAIGTAKRRVLLWTPAQNTLDTLGTHADFIYDVRFSPDGSTIATASHDRTVGLWSLTTHRHRFLRAPRPIRSVDFSPDGHLLASADISGTLRLIDLTSLAPDTPSAAPARLTTATTATIDATSLATTAQP